MKKYFVCSDIHGFFNEWINSLMESGFDKYNPNHILIVLGDIFDRGSQPLEVYNYIRSFPTNRVILIRGNHEYLLLDLLKRKYPLRHDYSNGTFETLTYIYKNPEKEQYKFILENKGKIEKDLLYALSGQVYNQTYKELFTNEKVKEIARWIKSKRWKDYFELDDYIFVHAFIPLKGRKDAYLDERGKYYSDWRNNTSKEGWEEATWGCPYKLYLNHCFDEELKNNKVLVCGHWYTSDFYNKMLYKDEPERQLDARIENPIFKSDLFPGLIGIDACTALTKKVNVLIIESEK